MSQPPDPRIARAGFPYEPSTCGPKGNHSDGKNTTAGGVTRCKVCGEIIWATIEYRDAHLELKIYK